MPDQPPIRIWALLGPHRGDNNQVLALARALGFPFEEKQLSYNRLRSLQPALLGASLRSLDPSSRSLVEGEPPDLTISTGHRSVPVVRALKRRSSGRMRSVHLGYPRIAPRHFDLVVPTPEYPIADAPNVLRVPFALSPLQAAKPDRSELAELAAFSHPRRLFVLGGPTFYWELPLSEMIAVLDRLLERSARDGGSVWVVGSPRTPDDLIRAIREKLAATPVPVLMPPNEGSPSYRALLEGADEIYVTADSVAMVADTVNTGKPVGIVPIARSSLGRLTMAVMDKLRPGKRLFPRDLRFFWAALRQQGFGGTLDAPRASEPPDYIVIVADRVRQLLEQPPRLATDDRDSGRRGSASPAARDPA